MYRVAELTVPTEFSSSRNVCVLPAGKQLVSLARAMLAEPPRLPTSEMKTGPSKAAAEGESAVVMRTTYLQGGFWR